MERLTNHFDYCDFISCKYRNPELAKANQCNFFDMTNRDKCHDKKIYEKLREYEDAEEQGLLIRLPFPIGTELYFPFKLQGIIKDRIRRWQLNKNGLFFCSYAGNAYRMDAIGKTVFLTMEDVEAALERMK